MRVWVLAGLLSFVLAAACSAPSEDGRGGHGGTKASTAAAGGTGGVGGVGGQGSSTASSSSSSSKSSTVASTGSGGITAAEALGRACTGPADCGPLTCVLPDSGKFGGEGPQGGICAKPCSSDATCGAIVSGAVCIDLGGPGYCMLGCSSGSSTPKSAKCRGRDDVACTTLYDSNGNPVEDACLPTCSSDAECGPGLFCDYFSGLCTETPQVGLALGAACDPAAADSGCASHFCACANAQCTTGFCSGFCEYGSALRGCGGPGSNGFCGLFISDGVGAGDIALCAQLCNCNADCGQPQFACDVLAAADQQQTGYQGECFLSSGQTLPVCCSCQNKVCGNDGCGGSCGTCTNGDTCVNGGQCCAACSGKACGDDGCGGTCGTCGPGLTCDAQGQCVCVPDCTGKACGNDGCGGSCGSCMTGEVCASGACCTPDCAGKECGSDGCGGSCGGCASNEFCNSSAQCQCQPNCLGKTCGPDGCGGTCGSCTGTAVCSGGSCCTPNCSGKTCGSDGCGGSCGACSPGSVCTAMNQCCTPAADCFNDSECCGKYCDIVTDTCVTCLPNGSFPGGNPLKCCSHLANGGNCVACEPATGDCSTTQDCCTGLTCTASGICL